MGNHKIVNYEGYGHHIPLKCKNHPSMRWSTKNIDYIGARSIYYNLMGVGENGPECNCSISCLEPLTEDEYIEYLYKLDAR